MATTDAPPPADPLDCSGARVLAFGSSIDTRLDNPDFGAVWSDDLLERALAARFGARGLVVEDRAAPGAPIIGPNRLGLDTPEARLVTAVPSALAGLTAQEQARTVIVIDPSFVEFHDLIPGDTDAVSVARAVDGIRQVLAAVRADSQVDHVIVMPTPPVHVSPATPETSYRLLRRIRRFNEELARLGISPATMRVSPLLDAEGRNGDWRYFDDYFNPFTSGPDGIHPDVEGQQLLADTLADLPEMAAALTTVCTADE